MNRILCSTALLFLSTATTLAAETNSPIVTVTTNAPGPNLSQNLSPNPSQTRAQDNFFLYVNGAWLESTAIPVDKSSVTAFQELRDAEKSQLRDIIEDTAKARNAPGSEAQKIGDLYASLMDEAALESIGLKALKDDFAKVAAIKSKQQIPALIAYFNQTDVTAPYEPTVHQDNKNSSRYILDLMQSGLGLPDRDYYLRDDDARLKNIRLKYQDHIAGMLTMAGESHAAEEAEQIIALETSLARAQWSKVDNRDPIKVYNKLDLAALAALTPGYDWDAYFKAAGLKGKLTDVIVSQPNYLTAFSQLVEATPLPVWKSYFKWRLLDHYAPYLSKQYADEDFNFHGTALNGVQHPSPRWEHALKLEESALGEAMGKLYVARYFHPESKARVVQMAATLLQALRQDVDAAGWMDANTKKEAQAKLATLMIKVGYPDTWRDYAALKISKNDLAGNVRRAAMFEFARSTAKLGRSIDRAEWGMTPQTLNAYYNPELNEVELPAAMLQAPFFNAEADDAVNYGAVGTVLAHQMSDAVLEEGSQYDANGNLRDWWSRNDHTRYASAAGTLINQYGQYSPLPGYKVNGRLTLSENASDNAGLELAYKAWRMSLHESEPAIIDGKSGDQRFYLAYGTMWRGKLRDNAMILRLKTDPHSPPEFRVNGAVRNQASFYTAFDVKAGDALYLAPQWRVSFWDGNILMAVPALPYSSAGFVDLNGCKPPYPRASKLAKEQGTVKLQFTVGADGKLINTVVLKSSTYANLDEATVSGLARCTFKPAVKDGKPVEASFTADWVWKLD